MNTTNTTDIIDSPSSQHEPNTVGTTSIEITDIGDSLPVSTENCRPRHRFVPTPVLTPIGDSPPVSPLSSDTGTTANINAMMQMYTYNDELFRVLCSDSLFWIRIFSLLLCVLLLSLSVTYCIGQLIDVKLDIITECPEPKTRNEIWKHSYDAYLRNGAMMNDESQFGFTKDACYTTKKIEINTNELWYYNQYTPQWKTHVTAMCVFFGLISVYICIIISYNIVTLIIDIIMMKLGRLHTQSSLYKKYMRQQHASHQRDPSAHNNSNAGAFNFKHFSAMYWEFYFKYLVNDTTGWIVMKFLAECTEFTLQTQALLLYNGYHVFDAYNEADVYLANKPHIVIVFACVLSFNCVGSGILWLLYAFMNKRCFGFLFKRCIFFVDKFSDLLYTLFPFYVLFADDYNKNTNDIWILLGQLNINSGLAFVATFVPLFFLCNKCLIMSITTRAKMVNNAFRKWKSQITKDKEITVKHYNQSWINKGKNKRYILCRQCFIALVGLCFIAHASTIFTKVIVHLQSSETYCASFGAASDLSDQQRATLALHPELMLYDHCIYKVYPFVNAGGHGCQCRVFEVNWEHLNSTEEQRRDAFNVTQGMILSGALDHWYMLEKFHTFGKITGHSTKFILQPSMYKSVHMKAFEWKDTHIVSFHDGISAWNELEYASFVDTAFIEELPHDFGSLKLLQILLMSNSGLSKVPNSLCELELLRALEISFSFGAVFQSLPHCMSQMKELRTLWIDIASQMSNIPLSLFNLPNLMELSLFNDNINYNDVLHYNNITIDPNDTMAMDAWFDANFYFNGGTQYWLAFNPICDDIRHLPRKLQQFINSTSACYYPCDSATDFDTSNVASAIQQVCAPRFLGDGRCHAECMGTACFLDFGDCAQLCFEEELTNCTYQKFTNDKCDDGCNNNFCSEYRIGANFELQPRALAKLLHSSRTGKYYYVRFAADNYQCRTLDDAELLSDSALNFSMADCRDSWTRNVYVDRNVPSDEYTHCSASWVGNGACDDSCRSDECMQDGGDCVEGNGCVTDSNCDVAYGYWNLLMPASQYKFSHTFVCANVWPIVEAVFPETQGLGNCSYLMKSVDYNKDNHLNFREYIAVAGEIVHDSTSGVAKQMNCSECVGMQFYNI